MNRVPVRLRPGAVLGPYHLVDRLGGGGVAEVWSARVSGDAVLKALKVLVPGPHETPRDEAMFRDEAELAVRLVHPNIVRTHALLDIDGVLVQVMDVENGIDLEAVLRRLDGVLKPWVAGAHVLREVAEGMSFAHGLEGPDGESLGLVHRDLTPSNIFLSWTGEVKVLDFGIAWTRGRRSRAHTELGVVKGKVDYVSPELARNRAFDHRADIYSLGVLADRVVLAVLDGALRKRPSIVRLQALADQMRAPEPTQRPGSMLEVADDISEILQQESVDVPRCRAALVEALASARGGPPSIVGAVPPPQKTAVKPKLTVPHDVTQVDLEGSDPAGMATVMVELEATVVPTDALRLRPGSTNTDPVPAPSFIPTLGDAVKDLRLVEAVDANPMARVFRAVPVASPGGPSQWVRFFALAPTELQFEDEADRLSRLSSDRVLSVRGYGRYAPDLGFVILDAHEGETLSDALAAEPQRSLVHRLRVVREVAAALAEAHAYGVVHGYFNAASVFVEADTLAVRLDFAVAGRLSQDAAGMSKPSPEQKAGRPATMKTDLYLLGKLMVRAMGEDFRELSDELLELDPRHRPPNVVDVLLRLDDILSDITPLVVEPPTLPGGDLVAETLSGSVVDETHSGPISAITPVVSDRAETPVDGPLTRVVSLPRLEPPTGSRRGRRWILFGLGAVLIGLLIWSLDFTP